MRSVFIFIGVDVAVNNIKVFSVAVDMQQRVCIALLSKYKRFPTAVNNNKH